MASMSTQDEFADAVKRGDKVSWQKLLAQKKESWRFPLEINKCLFDTLSTRNTDALKDVLKMHPNLNSKDEGGEKPLHLAARFGPAEHIRLLVAAGSPLNRRNLRGLTPLHMACHYNNFFTAEALLKEGAYTSFTGGGDFLTPLHVALRHNCDAIVELLVRNGADPNAKSISRFGETTPLGLAIHSKNIRMVKAVLSTGTHLDYVRNSYGGYPLHEAVHTKNTDILKLLLSNLTCFIKQSDANSPMAEQQQILLDMTNSFGFSALNLAIKTGQYEMVKILLEAGADVRVPYHNQQPLEVAFDCARARISPEPTSVLYEPGTEFQNWDNRIVMLLCQQSGTDLERATHDGMHPIHLALEAGLYRVARYICSKVPHSIDRVDRTGRTPLHIACYPKSEDRASRLALIPELLDLGLSVNARTWDRGLSPLSFAVQQEDLEVVSLLLARTPDLNSVDVRGYTALHEAVEMKNLPIVEALLAAGAFVDSADFDCAQTPLILGATIGAIDVARCLLQNGANIRRTETRMGYSSLHRTINNFFSKPRVYLQMIQMLVMNNADLSQKDLSGLTPFQLMLHMMVCRSGEPMVVKVGLDAVKLLVESGSELIPWVCYQQHAQGLMRRSPMLALTYTGQYRTAYYLANMGWPLKSEMSVPRDDTQPGQLTESHWLHLPGRSPAQDALQGFLMLRMANPFSLRELCRTAIRAILVSTGKARRRDEKILEILTSIDRLPLPEMVRKYLTMQDRDYSNTDECWGKLLHLLPRKANDDVSKLKLADAEADAASAESTV